MASVGHNELRVQALSNNSKPVNRSRIYHKVIIQCGSSELKGDKATSDIEAARKECTIVSTVADSDHRVGLYILRSQTTFKDHKHINLSWFAPGISWSICTSVYYAYKDIYVYVYAYV